MQTIMYWVLGAVVVLALIIGGWTFFAGAPASSVGIPQGQGFGVGETRTITVTPSSTSTESADRAVPVSNTLSSQKVFRIFNGPTTAAAFIQTSHPTTTLARYVQQENGHVLDLILDNSGTVARAVSNTTIPGTAQGRWTPRGGEVILQYLEDALIKTVYVGLPASTTATSTRTQAVHLQFLPDNVLDYAVSSDGKNVVYLLKGGSGIDGYTAKIDGGSSKKLFSTPLSEVLVSWPSPTTILLQTKSNAGVSGAVFSVNAQTGAVVPLVYAPGITAIADKNFNYVIYQTRAADSSSYVHDTKTGKDKALSFNPIPEKCAWSNIKATLLYCASPLGYVAPSYLDLWHQGAASAADTLFSFDVATGQSTILATPGSGDGGIASDIDELAVSPDDRYLLFIKKGDRSLWGVRLMQ